MTIYVIAVLAIGAAVGYWAVWHEPRNFRVRRFEVQIENLESPLRAVAIGDLQPNTYHWPIRRLREVFAKVQVDEAPDLMFWLGDYYNGHTGASGAFLNRHPKIRTWVEDRLPPMDEIASAMSELKGRIGSFAVLGNHDWAWSGTETMAALERVDIKVLIDEIAETSHPDTGQVIQVLGYEDLSSDRMPDFDAAHRGLDDTAVQIGITHSPDVFPMALGGPPLFFAGHTHGGQVRFPFLGAILLPLRYKQYDRGWFAERHRRLFVTTGLGTSLPPLRFLCRPEIVVLELTPGIKEEE